MHYTNSYTWAARSRAWTKATPGAKARAAMEKINRHVVRRNGPQDKPKVTVIQYGGKPLLVFVLGRRYVSAFTWDRLLYKAVYGPWTPLKGTRIEGRLQ